MAYISYVLSNISNVGNRMGYLKAFSSYSRVTDFI